MVLAISDITAGVSFVEQVVEMTPLQEEDSGIDGGVSCQANIVPVSNGRYSLDIAFSCSVMASCSRCTENFKDIVRGNVRVYLRDRNTYADVDPEDTFLFSLEDEYVDVRQALYEEVVLESSIMPLCSDSCEGIKKQEEADLVDEGIDSRWGELLKLKKK